jgi:hypothetical protein
VKSASPVHFVPSEAVKAEPPQLMLTVWADIPSALAASMAPAIHTFGRRGFVLIVFIGLKTPELLSYSAQIHL